MAKEKKPLSMAATVQKYLRTRESGKRAYKRAEQLLDEIVQRAKAGQEIPLPGGKKAVVVDLYALKNKVYRAHGIGRYEIELVDE